MKFVLDRFVQRDGVRTADLKRSGSPAGSNAPEELPVRSICGFCATGCSLTIHPHAFRIEPTVGYPVNLGAGCPKGWEALTPLRSPDRMTSPLVRDELGNLREATWEQAAKLFCDRFRDVQHRHGAASVAFLSTGQIATEEMALLGAFAKFEMGMVHGDGNTRQCMATSAVAYKESFGFDAPPFTYADLEESDVIVLIGSNLCIAHPILWERVARNPHSPEIVVIDPRRTETACASTMHVQPRPGADLALFLGVAHELVRLNAVDEEFVREHTAGFARWVDLIAEWTPAVAAEASDISAGEITSLASLIARGKRVSFWWTMGVNQGHQAVRTAQAIINIALMTGSIGKPGTGANSITGQCNAMGSRLFSNTTNLFCGRSFTDAADRAEVASILDIDVAKVPTQSSLAYDQILDSVETGEIKALWVIATNTAHSWLDQDRTKAILSKLEFLVVQDLYSDTATGNHAHLFLPAAGWGEKDGSFINAERRVGRISAAIAPPGRAKTDFEIVRTLATAWSSGIWLDKWKTPEDGFQLLKKLSAGRPCDISGIGTLDDLDAMGIQWPYPTIRPSDIELERRLFGNGLFFHADGRARFISDPSVPAPESPDDMYPLILLTGRQSSAQWHTGTRTDRSAVLLALSPSSDLLQINPVDALGRSIVSGDRVSVSSRRGTEHFVAVVTPIVARGQVFASMHNPHVNRLTRLTIDPHSRQPAAKQSCIQVTRMTPERHRSETRS